MKRSSAFATGLVAAVTTFGAAALAQVAPGGNGSIPTAAGGTSTAIGGGTMGPHAGTVPGGGSAAVGGGTMGPTAGAIAPGGGSGAVGSGTLGPAAGGTVLTNGAFGASGIGASSPSVLTGYNAALPSLSTLGNMGGVVPGGTGFEISGQAYTPFSVQSPGSTPNNANFGMVAGGTGYAASTAATAAAAMANAPNVNTTANTSNFTLPVPGSSSVIVRSPGGFTLPVAGANTNAAISNPTAQ